MTLLRRLRYRLVRDGRQTCRDCWRHNGDGWAGGGIDFLVSTAVWNFVMAGQEQTTLTIREGLFDDRLSPRVEGVAGVVCLSCFDRRSQVAGIEYRDHLIVFGRDCWMGGSYTGLMPL